MAKFISLPLSPRLYNALSLNAEKQGKSISKYAVSLLKSDVILDPSFAQKGTVGKTVSGQSIIDNGDMVFLNGIYYDYRLKGQIINGQKPEIQKQGIYKIAEMDGNIAVLTEIRNR